MEKLWFPYLNHGRNRQCFTLSPHLSVGCVWQIILKHMFVRILIEINEPGLISDSQFGLTHKHRINLPAGPPRWKNDHDLSLEEVLRRGFPRHGWSLTSILQHWSPEDNYLELPVHLILNTRLNIRSFLPYSRNILVACRCQWQGMI